MWKEFQTIYSNDEINTYSKECSNKYAAIICKKKERKITKIYKWCENEFHSKSNLFRLDCFSISR